MTQFDYYLKHIDQLHVHVSNSFLCVFVCVCERNNRGHSFKRSLSWINICIDDDRIQEGYHLYQGMFDQILGVQISGKQYYLLLTTNQVNTIA